MTARTALALRYLGLTIRVRSADLRSLDWLEEFVVPPFEPADGGVADCAVSFEADTARYELLLGRGTNDGSTVPCFSLDQGTVSLAFRASPDGRRIVHDPEFDVFYEVSAGGRVEVLTAAGNPAARIGLMRVVREFAMSRARRSGVFVAHAAALQVGGAGLVLAGFRQAGKTSLLVHLLRSPGARYVANDRVLLDLEGGRAGLRGMPTLVSIRPGTLAMFPMLRDALAACPYHHSFGLGEAPAISRPTPPPGSARSLSPAQFCELLGVPRAAGARLGAILFPRVSGEPGGIELERLSPAATATRLAGAAFGKGLAPPAGSVFDASPDEPDPPASSVPELCRAIASGVPGFECQLGRDAYRDGAGVDALLQGLGC